MALAIIKQPNGNGGGGGGAGGNGACVVAYQSKPAPTGSMQSPGSCNSCGCPLPVPGTVSAYQSGGISEGCDCAANTCSQDGDINYRGIGSSPDAPKSGHTSITINIDFVMTGIPAGAILKAVTVQYRLDNGSGTIADPGGTIPASAGVTAVSSWSCAKVKANGGVSFQAVASVPAQPAPQTTFNFTLLDAGWSLQESK